MFTCIVGGCVRKETGSDHHDVPSHHDWTPGGGGDIETVVHFARLKHAVVFPSFLFVMNISCYVMTINKNLDPCWFSLRL